MVKPDVKHNYYADLELPTTASIEDIRKAYRKLALQYHPDRNAGKEGECVPRFQAIQAANEILSDPATKTKYDQDRRKLFPSFSRPTAPSGNPYQAASAYPPPPRRTQPNPYQRTPSAYAPAANGADRFSNFAKSGNPPPPRNGPAADRTEQFRAWQNMNTPGGPERSRFFPKGPPPPPPPRSPNPQAPNPNKPRMQRQDTKMPTEEQIRAGMRHGTSGTAESPAAEKQSAWQAFNQASSGKTGMPRTRAQRKAPTTPRRPGGFDPSAPGSDERPAPSSSDHYAHRHRAEDLAADGFPPPPPGPPPTSAPHSPTDSRSQRPFVNPLRPFKTTAAEDVPYAEGNRTSTPYTSFIGEKTTLSSEGLRRSVSTRDTSRLNPGDGTARSSRARSQSPVWRQKKANDAAPAPKGKPNLPDVYSDSSDVATDGSTSDSSDGESAEMPESHGSATNGKPLNTASEFANPAQPPRERVIRKPMPPSSKLNNSNISSNAGSPHSTDSSKARTQSDGDQPSMQQRASSTNIFNFPINSDTARSNAGKSRSVENINTQFSPEGFPGTFQGTPDYFAATGRRPSPGRRNPSTRRNRPATTDGPSTSDGGIAASMGPPPRPDIPLAHTSPDEVKFSSDEWKNTFKDASWTWQAPPPGISSDSKVGSKVNSRTQSRQSSRIQFDGNAQYAGTKEQPYVVDEDGDDINLAFQRGTHREGPVADAGDAMDIDSPPSGGQPEIVTNQDLPSAKEPRLCSVPPSTWRQQQQEKQPLQTPSRGKAPVETVLKTNLDDLSQVEPIARSASGLRNLTDMSSTLPFSSEAAKAHPTKPTKPEKLAVPAVPKVPDTPAKLSKANWHTHTISFGAYLQRFHEFNKTMLAHFEARQTMAEERFQKNTNWLEAIGDTSNELGFGDYLKGARQDEQVRETWNVACEKHLEAVNDFDKLRERVRKLAVNGSLVDA